MRFLEFFAANIRNPHTRRTYARATEEFLAWRAADRYLKGYVCTGGSKPLGPSRVRPQWKFPLQMRWDRTQVDGIVWCFEDLKSAHCKFAIFQLL